MNRKQNSVIVFNWKRGIQRGLFWLFTLSILMFLIGPYVWSFLSSFKERSDLLGIPPTILPASVTLSSYSDVFKDNAFVIGLLNSFVVSVVSTLAIIIVGGHAAYGFSRAQFKGSKHVLLCVLGLIFFPPMALLGPLYRLLKTLDLLDSLRGLGITYVSIFMPFGIWLLTSYFNQIPRQIEEAALIDGCSVLQTFYLVIAPIAAPGFASTFIILFFFTWSEFFFALTLISSVDTYTITLALYRTFGLREIAWGKMAAGTIVATIPLVVLSVVAQRLIVEGLTAGSVKG